MPARLSSLTWSKRLAAAACCAVALALAVPLWGERLYVNLGRIELRRGQAGQALAHAEQALAWGEGGRAQLLAGLSLAELGEDERAAAHLERAAALDPADASACFHLAEALYRLGRTEAAVEQWRAAGAVERLRVRAAAASNAKDLAEAEEWHALATQVAPESFAAWLGLAQVRAARADWPAAYRTYAEVVARFPERRLGYEGLAGLQYNQLKDKSGAVATLDEGLARTADPKQQLYYLRSVYRQALGNGAGAEADARQAIALAPNNAGYLAWLGDLYLQQKRYDEALAQYRLTGEQAADRTWLWRSRQKAGAVYAALKDWPAAIAEYRGAVEISREQGASAAVVAGNYVQLGNQLVAAKLSEEAAEAYGSALALDPANRDAGRLLQELQRAKN